MKYQTGAIILAAGNSSRMGFDKALLPYNENTNFIDHIISVYLQFGCKVILVANPNLASCISNDKVEIITNNYNRLGRIYSLQLGLKQLTKVNYCFIQNIDNPFISINLLSDLYTNRNENAYMVPVYSNKSGHPVLFSSIVMNYISGIKNYAYTLNQILKRCNKKTIEVNDPAILANINTPEDYSFYYPNYSLCLH